jgi:hypothetical protein
MCVPQISQRGEVVDESEPRKISLQVFYSFAEIVQMQHEWDAFMEALEADIFLTYDWCRIWWKYYGKNRKLVIFVFKHGSDICAILPLFFERIWLGPLSIRIVKVVGSDYMPVTMTVPIQSHLVGPVLELLMEVITVKWKWDLFHLGALCGRYGSVKELERAFETTPGGSYYCEAKSKDVQTYFQVASTWDQQVAGLARKQRTNAKRTYRELSSKEISVKSVLASEESFQIMFEKFVEMHQAHWKGIGMPGHFVAWPSAQEFHLEVARIQLQRNRLRLLQISFNDQVVGYEYLYKFGKIYLWYLNSRAESKYNRGIDYKWVAFREKTSSALKDGVECIDGMRGRYEYKLLMGGKYSPIYNLYIYSRKLHIKSRVLIFRFLFMLVDVSYSKIWRTRIAPRLGIQSKAYWEKWIRVHSLY